MTVDEILERVEEALLREDTLPIVAKLQIVTKDIIKERYGIDIAIAVTEALLKDLREERS